VKKRIKIKVMHAVVTLLLSTMVLHAQQNDLLLFVSGQELIEEINRGQLCKAFADLDNDYREEIVGLDSDNTLCIYHNSDNGAEYLRSNYRINDGVPWTISVGDLNRDGFNDIITSGVYNGLSIWSRSLTESKYEVSKINETDFFAQTSNLVDIDNDGWLDLFVCNDDGLNAIFINDGTGSLVRNRSLIDMRTNPVSDNSGNYASEWSDIDMDGDLDLYIAKCRIGVNDPADPRRINMLFINDNGTFREAAAERGVAAGTQSWTGNFGDFDNDGDMDLFVGNHGAPCMLFENNGDGYFTEIKLLASGEDLITEVYQSAFHDLNNDSYVDIVIGGSNDLILINNQGQGFEALRNPFGFNDIRSFALSDANRDGFTDVLASYNIFNPQGIAEDKLWLNLGNENHFIKIYLQGDDSNINGIGARVELFGPWGKQCRILQSGNGYTVTHSLSLHFGLNDYTKTDSLVIYWPSGLEDKYYNLEADQFYLAIENSCCEKIPTIYADRKQLDCDNDKIQLHSENAVRLNWSNGLVSDSISIDTAQSVMAYRVVSDNCKIPSQWIHIDSLKAPEKAQLDISGTAEICATNNFYISERYGNILQWGSGQTASTIPLDMSGYYYAIDTNKCYTSYSDSLFLKLTDPQDLIENKDTLISEPMPLVLNQAGSEVIWFSDKEGRDTIAVGNNFRTDSLRIDTSFYFSRRIDQMPPQYTIGLSIDREMEHLAEANLLLDLSTIFQLESPVLFNSVKINAANEGWRIFHIIEFNTNSSVFSDSIYCLQGINTIPFNLLLQEGEYMIQTDEFFNLDNYQNPSPGFLSYTGEAQFPYEAINLISVKRSIVGTTVYGYYFDWQFMPVLEECRTPVSEYHIELLINGTKDTYNTIPVLTPNPFSDHIDFQDQIEEYPVRMIDLNGKKILRSTTKLLGHENLSFLEKGIYFLMLYKDSKIHTFKIIKM
jgi:hypothetical protein